MFMCVCVCRSAVSQVSLNFPLKCRTGSSCTVCVRSACAVTVCVFPAQPSVSSRVTESREC